MAETKDEIIKRQEAEITYWKEQVTAARDTIRDTEEGITGVRELIRKRINKVETEIREKDDQIGHLIKEAQDLQTHIDLLRRDKNTLESKVKYFKDKLSAAYGILYPEGTVKKKETIKETVKKVSSRSEAFVKKNKDGTVDVGGFTFIFDDKPKRSKKKTVKIKKAKNAVRNIRRR